MIHALTPPPVLPTIRMLSLISSFLALLSVFVPNLQALDINSYISTEGPIAKVGLLANIGPSGSKADGALAGIVCTSPHVMISLLFVH
jgi:glucoamylase